MSAPLIRPDNCTKCKFREQDMAGVWRCHGRPPQRSLFLAPTPKGPQLMTQVAWPELPDEIALNGWCGDFKPKILAAAA
jgi:hypothetical protein